MMMYTEEKFAEAETYWDLERLYTDLAAAKRKHLTLVEKLHLRALLCGYPAEIAKKCHKSAGGLKVNLCNTLYLYVKTLVNRDNEKMNSWQNVREWLEEVGYKTQSATQSKLKASLPVDATVKVSNAKIEKIEEMNVEHNTITMNIEHNTITIDINIRLTAPVSLEPSKED